MSVVAIKEILTLERAIEQQLNLGKKDPHVIYDELEKQLGAKGLLELATPHLPDLISDMARQRMNTLRRADLAKITETNIDQPEIMLRALWVPDDDGIVYKRIADMTADDFDARAAYLERMTAAISRHALWCRNVAEQIRKRKIGTAGELERLPGLPELEQ